MMINGDPIQMEHALLLHLAHNKYIFAGQQEDPKRQSFTLLKRDYTRPRFSSEFQFLFARHIALV